MIDIIYNEDGTVFDPPKNPLAKKWRTMYPPCQMNGLSYSCMFCGKCQHGDNWRCPEEDLEVYGAWKNETDNYIITHNPSFGRVLNKA